uniref:Reverse transcriptase RNase H-like domain-containing protein n=1 Tax=Knipowitschia caucasica TaxID=637954 RepID=A0AAV2JV68_KNICA
MSDNEGANQANAVAGGMAAAMLGTLSRELAQHCNYGDKLKEMLRYRLVCGIAEDRIQRRLLAEPDLTFEKALKITQAIETANRDVRDLQPTLDSAAGKNATPMTVHKVGTENKRQNGQERPIGFMSRTLTPAESNYSQLDKEGLAVMFGIQRFHKYLYGRRWAVTLRAYEYEIVYKPGKYHSNADALSRLPLPQPSTEKVQEDRVLMMEDALLISETKCVGMWTRYWTDLNKKTLLTRRERHLRQYHLCRLTLHHCQRNLEQ